jgi:hypothetical protein
MGLEMRVIMQKRDIQCNLKFETEPFHALFKMLQQT